MASVELIQRELSGPVAMDLFTLDTGPGSRASHVFRGHRASDEPGLAVHILSCGDRHHAWKGSCGTASAEPFRRARSAAPTFEQARFACQGREGCELLQDWVERLDGDLRAGDGRVCVLLEAPPDGRSFPSDPTDVIGVLIHRPPRGVPVDLVDIGLSLGFLLIVHVCRYLQAVSNRDERFTSREQLLPPTLRRFFRVFSSHGRIVDLCELVFLGSPDTFQDRLRNLCQGTPKKGYSGSVEHLVAQFLGLMHRDDPQEFRDREEDYDDMVRVMCANPMLLAIDQLHELPAIQRLHVEASARDRFDAVRRQDDTAYRDLVSRITTHGQGGGRQFVTACHELLLLLFRVLAVLLESHWLGTLLRLIYTEEGRRRKKASSGPFVIVSVLGDQHRRNLLELLDRLFGLRPVRSWRASEDEERCLRL